MRRPKLRTWTLLAAAIGLTAPLAIGVAPARADEEWEQSTPLYEDDAWYDVTEWFDGNDYNPTDEAIGRWDDETYDTSDALTSTDVANDVDWSDSNYGYYADNDRDWFYDYYDYGYYDYGDYDYDGDFDYSAQYYDYDGDGLYDAYASLYDTDGDEIYDDFTYVSFSEPDPNRDKQNVTDAQNRQKDRRAKMQEVSGSIKMAKKVQTPGGTNLVVQLSGTDSEKSLVDLGPANQFDPLPRIGDQVTVHGFTLKAGDKNVLLAQKVEHAGETATVNRSGRQYSGTVQSTKTIKVRGEQHQIAKLSTKDNKTFLVDLGPADALDADVKKGKELTVTGPAIEIKDRPLLMANQLTMDGKTFQVKRPMKK